MTIGDIASLIVALATTGSLIYISRQFNVSRIQAKGQFLLMLDAQFEKFNSVTMRLVSEKNFVPESKDWPEVFGLMSVFERISIMAEDKILDIPLVDRLHGFRLVYIINNDAIYKRVSESGAEWQDFIDICYAVADHREKGKMTHMEQRFVQRVRTLSKESRSKNPFSIGLEPKEDQKHGA